MNKSIFLVSFIITISICSSASKMDLDGYNTVISKFEKALTLMKDGTVKSNDLNKRLGDLYAEKARLTFFRRNEGSVQEQQPKPQTKAHSHTIL